MSIKGERRANLLMRKRFRMLRIRYGRLWHRVNLSLYVMHYPDQPGDRFQVRNVLRRT